MGKFEPQKFKKMTFLDDRLREFYQNRFDAYRAGEGQRPESPYHVLFSADQPAPELFTISPDASYALGGLDGHVDPSTNHLRTTPPTTPIMQRRTVPHLGVNENTNTYHRLGCPRSRADVRPVSYSELKDLQPCLVCKPDSPTRRGVVYMDAGEAEKFANLGIRNQNELVRELKNNYHWGMSASQRRRVFNKCYKPIWQRINRNERLEYDE